MAKERDLCVTRPGGFQITDEAVKLCRFTAGARLGDIGCGYGETAKYLSERYGFDVIGIDVDEEVISRCADGGGYRFVRADARCLSFADCSLDGLLYECSFSKMDEPERVLAEAFRTLKSGGRIALSDFYAAGAEMNCCGLLGRIESAEHIGSRLAAAGFEQESFTDFSGAMRELFGQLIFDYGRDELCAMLGGSQSDIGAVKPAYGLFISVKNEHC